MVNTKPYRHAMIFSGGGLRFGYYLGMYQAFCDVYGERPDLVFASCGGAIALGLLTIAPNHAYQALLSKACYRMLCRIRANPSSSLTTYALPALKRYIFHQLQRYESYFNIRHYQDITTQSLFAIEHETDFAFWQEHEFFDELTLSTHTQPINHAIILSQLHTINTPIPHYQWQEVVQCFSPTLYQKLNELPIACVLSTYNCNYIQSSIRYDTHIPLFVAIRASIADMYYLPPINYQQQTLFGGVLDLMPIEIVSHLANVIFIDDKPNYDKKLAEPAIRHIFGFNANQRLAKLKHTTFDSQIHWLNLSDSQQKIQPALKKDYQWRQGYIKPIYPTYDEFKKIMHTQWQYGYQRTKTQLTNLKEYQ